MNVSRETSGRKRETPARKRETSIYAEFERLLAERRIDAVPLRCNAGDSFLPNTDGSFRRVKGLPTGFPDYLVLVPDGLTFIEFKTARGTQSEAQKAFEATCARLRLPYTLARSAEEGIDAVLRARARGRL